MKFPAMLTAGCVAIAMGACGCSAAPQAGSNNEAEVTKALAPTTEKPYHEWSKVYLVETRSGTRTRKHVGFLDRRYTESDREGIFFVRDRTLQMRGFTLPSGKTYVNEARPGKLAKMKFVGSMTMERAVRDLLDARGDLEFEKVHAASTAPSAKTQ